jgi:hypothetical protein
MSASPGAYLTSLQTGIWYRVGSQYWVLPVVVNASISANATYGPFVFPTPLQSIFGAILTVTAVSGTSPTLTVAIVNYDVIAVFNGTGGSGSSTTLFSSVSSTGVYTYTTSNTVFTDASITLTVGGTSPSFTITLTIYIRE